MVERMSKHISTTIFEQKLKCNYVAKECGITTDTLRKIRNGSADITIKHYVRVMEFLGISL